MNLKALLESKIREYDASIDVSDGSRIQRTVITPVVSALSTDPLSVGTREYLYARFSEAFPDAPITRGNALDDILITATEYFMDGYREELSRLKNATSLSNLDLLSDEEANALASNWFVFRDEGANAAGAVTVTVDRTAPISITTGTVRFFAGETEYAPTVNTVVSTDALLAEALGGGLYTFTINVRALAVGTAGNVPESSITRVSGIANVVSVTNESPILGGLGRDTTEFLLSNKLPRAISERSLVTARGMGARIVTDVPGILRYQVIGHGDIEMLRDRVETQSYGDLIAAGHAYYVNNFALIAAYPYTSETVTPNDELCGFSPTGAPEKYQVSKVLGSLDINVLNNNALGFTKLVELSKEASSYKSSSISVLRPGTALLNDTYATNSVGLGGRSDIYIRGDSLQSAIGSAVLSYEDSIFSGPSWVASGNTVILSLVTPIVGNEFSRYDHIVLEGVAYTISATQYVAGDLEATITLFNADLGNTFGGSYSIFTDFIYRTGVEAQNLSPSIGGLGGLSCIIGSAEVTILDVDLVADGVRQGDIIEIPELHIRRAVFSVSGPTTATVDAPFQQTLTGVGARVIRPITKVVSPITELQVASASARHPISIDVASIREESGLVTTGVGNILLPLGESLVSAYEAADVTTVFANVLNRYNLFYAVPTNGEGGLVNNRLAPLSRGYDTATLGQCSVLVGEPTEILPNATSEKGINEFKTWTDLFTNNCNNIFVLRGDATTSAKELNPPGRDIRSGDILRIHSGYLAGDYVIESTIHNTLLREGEDALTGSVAQNIVGHGGEYTYRDIADTASLPANVLFQKITLVRIYGRFPNNPLSILSKYLNLDVTYRFIGLDPADTRVGSISSTFMNSYLNGRADMFTPSMSQSLISEFRDEAQTSLLPSEISGNILDISEMFSEALNATYDIIRPSESKGYIKTLNPDDEVLLSRPSVTTIDINDLMVGLAAGDTRTLKYREHTEVLGSAGVYHLSPKERYYVGGQSYEQWAQILSPVVQDDRVFVGSYQDRYVSDFVLFDELVEASSAGLHPITVTGVSSVEALYLRDSGAAIVRYPEISVTNSSLGLSSTLFTSGDSFIFGGMAFAEPETRIIPLNSPDGVPRCYILPGPDDDISIYGDVPGLKYSYVGDSGRYNEIQNLFGNAVDGSGTPLSEVYGQYEAFFEVPTGHTSSSAVVDYLVNLYSSAVEARFWGELPEDGYFVVDEFSMPSLLSTSASEYSTSEPTGRPISIATVAERADKLEIIPSTTLNTLTPELTGCRARISYRDQIYWRRVAYADSLDIYLDEPLPFGTPNATAYGLCIYDSLNNKIKMISDPIFPGGLNALDPWAEEFTTHLNTGGSSRLLTDADVGSHITLWGYNTNDSDYLSVLVDASTPEYETYDEFIQDLSGPERKTFGQFEITGVVSTFVDTQDGALPVPAVVEVSISGIVTEELPRLSASDATLVICAFAVTAPTVTIEEGMINAVTEVTLYKSDPYVYNLVGVNKHENNKYLIQALEGNLNYEYISVSDLSTSGEELNTFSLQYDNSLEPTTVETNYLVQVRDGEEVIIRTTNASTAVTAQSMKADANPGLGYDLMPSDLGKSMSFLEDVLIRVPATPGEVADTLPVAGYFDISVGQSQALVSSTNERPICADILVKSLHASYIGVDIMYVGGPTESEVVAELTEFIKSRVLANSTITRSKISALVMSMGASSVHEPIDLYICVEDNSRRVHKRTIVNGLEESTLFGTDSTLRTLYPTAAIGSRLGAEIKVQRFNSLINLIGSGGS